MPLEAVQGKIPPIDKQRLEKLVELGHYGSESDAVRQAVRLLVEKHTKDLGKLQREPRGELSQDLSQEDKDLLIIVAEDHWNQFYHFEEESVHQFLKNRNSTQNWPDWKIEQAVDFVCSLKKN